MKEIEVPGMVKNETISFVSAEALESYVDIRVEAVVNQRLKDKVLDGWITGQEAIDKGYFPFKMKTLKKKIETLKIEGRIESAKEVYVKLQSVKKYITGE